MSSTVIPKEQMTAFERWELASFDLGAGAKNQGQGNIKKELVTVAEVESIRQQAYKEGHDSGYTIGIQQARSEAEKINGLMQGIQSELNQLDELLAHSLLDLSLEVARKMVSEILLAKPEVVLKIVSDAIVSLPHFNQSAHLILHPEDAELVRQHMGEQLQHSGWKFLTDPQISRGGLRVETAHTSVDATVEARWKCIVDSIGQDKSWLG